MKKVAVVMGGYSDEYKVSLKSGQLIFDSIDTKKFEPYKVHILEEGWFAWVGEKKILIDKGDFSFNLNGEKIQFDVIFNIIHGTPGEDGILQAYWQILDIPFVGCPHYQSALTFNKKDCIAVLNKYGIPSAQSIYLTEGDVYDLDQIISTVGLPCFVKPNQSGSSLGISKVKHKEGLEKAFEKAFAEDKNILIESFLDGTEVSVGVIEYEGEVRMVGMTEIVSHNEFFDYEAKYEGASEEITPARISPEVAQKIEEVAVKAYRSLGMSGMSRSEYIIVGKIPYFIEMNTLPGFSPASILPQQLGYAGISINQFVTSELTKALKNSNSKNI